MVQLRRFNAYFARTRRPGLERGSSRTVIGLQVAGLTADLIRGGLVTFLALAALHPIADAVVHTWSLNDRYSRAGVVTVCAAVAGAAAWKLFHPTAGARRLFALGLIGGLAMLLFR
jgi:PTS system mannose-specific IIC component